ncbi:hypothetical protein ACTQZS_07350 [Bilifractor sp. LCP19S3_H10]|uniref:hypothetical protein n=1 Tax=Bilifractor sp. LCP19S3_H10 TaxID=3438736 RepID=UPI003F90E710
MIDPVAQRLEDKGKEKGRAIMLHRLYTDGALTKEQLDAVAEFYGYAGEQEFREYAESLPSELGTERKRKPIQSMIDVAERLEQGGIDKGAVIVLGDLLDSGVLTEEQAVQEGRPFGISNMRDFWMCLRYSRRTEEDEEDEDHESAEEKK